MKTKKEIKENIIAKNEKELKSIDQRKKDAILEHKLEGIKNVKV